MAQRLDEPHAPAALADVPLFDEVSVFGAAQTDRATFEAPQLPAWPSASELHGGIVCVRALRRRDHERGLFDVLAQLTDAPVPDSRTWYAQFDAMRAAGDHYYTIVLEERGRIVACATLLVERKMVRNCACVGHIEDVVVHRSCRGRGFGRVLVAVLVRIAFTLPHAHVYKVLLDCDDRNVPFYERTAQFQRKDTHMALYRPASMARVTVGPPRARAMI